MLDIALAELRRGGFDGAEGARKRDLLFVVELLAVEHHHGIAIDGGLDGVAVGRRQGGGKVDIGDLGDEAGVRWRNRDAHNRLLRL